MKNKEIMAWANDLLDPDQPPFAMGFGKIPAFRLYRAKGRGGTQPLVLRRYTNGRRLILRDYEMIGALAGFGAEHRALEAVHERLDLIFEALPASVEGNHVRFAVLRTRPHIAQKREGVAVARARLSLAEEVAGEASGILPFFPAGNGAGAIWEMGSGLYDLKLSCRRTGGEEAGITDISRLASDGALSWQIGWSMARDASDKGQNLLLSAVGESGRGRFDLVIGDADTEKDGEDGFAAVRCEMAVEVDSLQMEEDVVLHCLLVPKGPVRYGRMYRSVGDTWRFVEQALPGEIKRKEGYL